MKREAVIVLISLAICSPANAALEYHVVKSTDPFTDQNICKIEFGTNFSRAFLEGMAEGVLGWYGLSYFYVERRGDEIVAGITNDRHLPIAGDIQIRVDDGPVTTITPADTPDDYLPPSAFPQTTTGYATTDQTIANAMRNFRAQMTPFRVLSGEKARALLSELVNGHHAIWRSVTMIAAANRGPAEIRIDGLSEALAECGIDVTKALPAKKAN